MVRTRSTSVRRDGRSVPASDATKGSSDYGRLAKHSSIYALGSLLNRVGAFLLLPVYTSYLTLGQYGRLELFYAVLAVASTLLCAGLSHATLRFYFEYEDEVDRRAVVSTNLVAATTLSLVGALTIGWFRDDVSHLFFGSTDFALGVSIILATVVLELSTQIGQAYLRATEKSGYFLLVVFSRLIVQVGVNSYLVVFAGAGVNGVLAGNLLSVAFGWLLAVGCVVRECGLRFDRQKAVPVLRYSLPFLLSMLVGVVASNVDRILIRSLLSFEALGLFALATKFSRLLQELVGEPFSRAYGSFRFSVMHQDNAAEIQSRVVRFLLAGCLLAALGIYLFAADVLAAMSNEAFHGAATLLPLLLVASIARVLTYPLQTGILVRKRTRHIFWINLADAVLYVGSSFTLIYLWGITGAVAAMAMTSIATMVLTGWRAQRYFAVDYQLDKAARIILIATACFFIGAPLLSLPVIVGIPLKGLLLAAFAAATFHSAAFADEERRVVVDWVTERWQTVRRPAQLSSVERSRA